MYRRRDKEIERGGGYKMKIRRSPLVFHNVLSVSVICRKNEWVNHARGLRNAIIQNGLYPTGPVIYTTENIEQDETMAKVGIYVPVNSEIELDNNHKYVFIKEMKFNDGLTLRHADIDEDIETVTYDTLRGAAQNYNLSIKEPFYNIYLDVYGEGIIDVYAPIEE